MCSIFLVIIILLLVLRILHCHNPKNVLTMLKAYHYWEQRSSFDIQANQSMEEMLQNSTAGFSDVLEKVCPPAVLMFSVM